EPNEVTAVEIHNRVIPTTTVDIDKLVTGPKGKAVTKDKNALFQVTASWTDVDGNDRHCILNVVPGKQAEVHPAWAGIPYLRFLKSCLSMSVHCFSSWTAPSRTTKLIHWIRRTSWTCRNSSSSKAQTSDLPLTETLIAALWLMKKECKFPLRRFVL